ncbi:hypothetical protein NDU88_002023 [Pleurodeles waltl]|uniref:Uncharacterized protein n=1 Tax=Pleurodeles waltl TaxID=8319 RepID=A0AAV7WR45_PLEWA|nr:hypothetical protein NDU88_002023 [Pleurodeles waltl]
MKAPPRGTKKIGGCREGRAAFRECCGARALEKSMLSRSGLGESPEPRPPALSAPGAAEDNRAAQERRGHSWAPNLCRPPPPLR